MITASVLAKRANVPIHTVRYYTRKGLLRPIRDLRNGYKMYRIDDRSRLRFIAAAKELGFTLNEIEGIFDHSMRGDSPCPMVREVVQKRIKENNAKIKELKKLQKRLESAAAMWATLENSDPDGHSVCSLIESFSDSEQEP